MRVLSLIGISVIAAGVGQILLKAGVGAAGSLIARDAFEVSGWLRVFGDWRVLLGLAAWSLSTLVYLLVLSRAQLSFAFCLGSLNYVFVPLVSRWLFAEHLSPLRLVGMAVIFAGVALTLWAHAADAASRAT